ncbi:MAG TPA: hypothetical protein VFZ67_03195 [Nitrososphaera sp.]
MPSIDTIRLPLLVVLIVSEPFAKVSVPFPETVDSVWVWFIGVSLTPLTWSW